MTGVDESKRVLDPGEAEFNPKGDGDQPPTDHLSRKRFGEPQEGLEAQYTASAVGVNAKIGHASPHVIAQAGNIILVTPKILRNQPNFSTRSLQRGCKAGSSHVCFNLGHMLIRLSWSVDKHQWMDRTFSVAQSSCLW